MDSTSLPAVTLAGHQRGSACAGDRADAPLHPLRQHAGSAGSAERGER
jgi:hypothetical protein